MKNWFTQSLIFCLMLLTVMPSVSMAYQVQPMSILLTANGRNSTKDFKIINDGTAPTAIQVSIVTREQNLDGSERRQPATDKFVVYPAQMVLKPKSTQNVRVQWLGDPHVAVEKSYRFILTQVPVNLKYADVAKSSFKFHVNMAGGIYIRPENASSNIVVSSSKVRGQYLDIILSNNGTGHSLLKNMVLTLKQSSRTLQLKGQQLYQMEGKNVLAGSRRQFSIPLPNGIRPDQPVIAELKYSQMVSQ